MRLWPEVDALVDVTPITRFPRASRRIVDFFAHDHRQTCSAGRKGAGRGVRPNHGLPGSSDNRSYQHGGRHYAGKREQERRVAEKDWCPGESCGGPPQFLPRNCPHGGPGWARCGGKATATISRPLLDNRFAATPRRRPGSLAEGGGAPEKAAGAVRRFDNLAGPRRRISAGPWPPPLRLPRGAQAASDWCPPWARGV